MKPSAYYLGQEIQYYLLRQRVLLEQLADEMGVTQEALSNMIHGRRRFKDETLKAMANTPLFNKGGFTLRRLRALRAMDEYDLSELMLAVLEHIKQGQLDALPDDFFDPLIDELARAGIPVDRQLLASWLAEKE